MFVSERYEFHKIMVNSFNIFGLEIKPLYCESGLTILQAGIKQNSTLVIIERLSGGYELLSARD